jgi:uncharacterized OB-fold protein
MSTTELPNLEALRATHTDALDEGRLTFQRCRSCGNAWLPPREECPHCLRADFEWQDASGAARLVSWCVYHRTPLPELADRVPYTVFIVELAEGPRLISSPAASVGDAPLAIDLPLQLVIEREENTAVARFGLA